ncbi:hypothetical protein [Candidatus Lokiarchaeum ossiferum]
MEDEDLSIGSLYNNEIQELLSKTLKLIPIAEKLQKESLNKQLTGN